jgi:hypothetical protein
VRAVNARAVDVAETLDGITDDMRMASYGTYREVSAQAGLEELEQTVQRLLAALQARNEAAGAGDLGVVKVA